MLNENAVCKKFTANGDPEAEKLLSDVLCEMKNTLDGSGLCVVLGGSYGRGDGGVRLDRENGILYNDLDFFVFAEKKSHGGETLLKEISKKYEHELKVDVDFSALMTVKDIKNNASRLMMQELKRGYHLVCGRDLLAENLPEISAEHLPFSEACRLLLNRGMGLLLAGEKIAAGADDTDFILRNICKAILGAGDAMLISSGAYRWKLGERAELIANSDLPDGWKNLYREAVEFKRAPHRQKKQDMVSYWHSVREFYLAASLRCFGSGKKEHIPKQIYKRCSECGETSFKNYVKYCIKSRSFSAAKIYTAPAAALLAGEVFQALDKGEMSIDRQSKLYRHWLIFN